MKFLTVEEIAEILKISYPTALAFIKQSGIDLIKIGKQYRVCEDKFFAFVSKKGHVEVPLNQ